jgi:hypothetical protein
MAEPKQNNIQEALGQSADYSAAFTQRGSEKSEMASEELVESSSTYTNLGIQAAEAAIVYGVLPYASLYAGTTAIEYTAKAAALATCTVNAVGRGVQALSSYIDNTKAEALSNAIDSGLNYFNDKVLNKTDGLCAWEAQMIYGAQKIVGAGVHAISETIQNPSPTMIAAGKTAMNFAFSAWDSVKCGCEYAYSFMASEKAECSGEAESLDGLI